MKSGPELSVVVIGRNEGDRLKRCFASIGAMQIPAGGLEVIYVDSSSRDRSIEIARGAGVTVIQLRPERPTAALARNAGWQSASGAFVLFVDGDSVIEPEFAVRSLPHFEDPRVAVVFGRTRELDPNASIFHRALDLHWWRPPAGPVEYCMGIALVRRSAIDAANGFDATLMAGEEPDLCARMRRLGYIVLCLNVPMVEHDLAIANWLQYWRRMTRKGYSLAEVSERYTRAELPDYHWQTRRSRFLGVLMLASAVTALSSGFFGRSGTVVFFLGVFWLGATFRNAWKVRHKSASIRNCLAFGIHHSMQAIPILCGQFRYYRDKKRGEKTLIEYKTIPVCEADSADSQS